MAYSQFLLILLPNLFFFLVASDTYSSSSIASKQLKFWSQNVDNEMPESIRSKLSPLSDTQTQAFTPLVSKPNFSSNPKFCAAANLVCSAVVKPLPPRNEYVHFTDKVSVPVEEVDPSSFFKLSALKPGRKITLPDLDSELPTRAFLPTRMSRNIPLSADELQRIFPAAFSIPETNAAVHMSLGHCAAPTVRGERRSCLRNLEDMVGFARGSLGRKHMVAMSSENTIGVGNQDVTVKSVTPYQTDKIVACHEVFFPFAVYYCHMLPLTHVYAVDVVNPKMGGRTNKILAICHMDTSAWTPEHVAFKLLKSSPGKGEACHWITQMDLVWIGYD